MKTFLWENKVKWIALLVFLAYLVGIRYVNVYHVWYTLTPWQNLGTPPKEAEKIAQVNLPLDGEAPPASVYVKISAREFYGCCNLTENKGWALADKPYYKFYASLDQKACTNWLRFQWGIQENSEEVKSSLDLGQCHPHIYTIYQLKQNGTIQGKTVSEEAPRLFKQASFELGFLLLQIDLIVLAFVAVKKHTLPQSMTKRPKLGSIRYILTTLTLISIASIAFRYFSDTNIKIESEFTGEYVRNVGWFYLIDLRADHTFYMKVIADFGGPTPLEDEGKFLVENERIRLIGSSWNEYANKFDFIPIQWGERKYLIEDVQLIGFCQDVYSLEPRTSVGGVAYLHQGDWEIPAEGEPVFMDGRKACP